MQRRAFFILIAGMTAWCCAGAAGAQPAHLDQGTLIDGLSRRSMSELLGHLVETEPAADSVAAAQIEIANDAMRAADPGLSRREQVQAVDHMLAVTRRLIAEHPDHEQRPIWQTNLAEHYFEAKLSFAEVFAAQFYEFGVCTAAQKQAVEENVAEIFIAMTQADGRFRQLEDVLARDAEHRRVLESTGQWTRMFDRYRNHKTQYYLGLAAYFTALLDDDHPYMRNLGDARVPLQRNTPAEERDRLLALAIGRLEPLVAEPENVSEEARLLCLSIIGRAQLRRGQYADAMGTLGKVAAANRADLTDLLSALGRAWAMHMNGQSGSSEDLLRTLDKHAWAQANAALRLLVKDELHRVLMDRADAAPADGRERAVAQAYEPYFDLLSEMRRQGDAAMNQQAAGLENYIYKRWQDNLDAQVDVKALPAAVAMGIGTAGRIEGEALAREAMRIQSEGDNQRASELREQAGGKLRYAVQVLEPLAHRGDLAPALAAPAMYNLGLATYWNDPLDAEAVLAACGVWIDLADALPGQSESEKAIEFAVKELARVYFLTPGARGYRPAFDRALEVLFTKYPATKFADDFRLSYVAQVLMPSGRYAEAARVAEGVPFFHVNFFESRRERLYALLEVCRSTPQGQERGQARQALAKAGQELLGESEKLIADLSQADLQRAVAMLSQANGDVELRRRGSALNAAGHARLVLAQLAEAESKMDEALALLDNFEERFAADADLAREGVSRRIGLLIAADRIGEAGAQAQRMMELFPDDAAGTVNQVADLLEKQIDELRKQASSEAGRGKREALTARAASLAQVLVTLTAGLHDWAGRQNFDAASMLPYQLVHIKALCLAQQGAEAVQLAETVYQSFPNEAAVRHAIGEALFTRGWAGSDGQDLIAAAGHFDVLIEGLQDHVAADGKRSELFWNAWMRRVQVMDKLGQYTQDIPIRVSNLLKQDPSLGGEPYRSELLRLRNKYARQ